MHKPVDRPHSAFLNQYWIRRVELSDGDFVERTLEIGDCRLHLRAQLLARQILRRKFSFAISFVLRFAEHSADEMPEIAR